MITLEIPSLPPTTNHAYMTVKKGKATIRVLTKEGKAYKAETTAWLAQNYPAQLATFPPGTTCWVAYIFSFPNLENQGYPDKAKNRYKMLDASNRVKLLEDVLAEVTAIDDANNMGIVALKRHGPTENTTVLIWTADDARTPFDELYAAAPHPTTRPI